MIRVDGTEISTLHTLTLPDLDPNFSFITVKRDENRCLFSYHDRKGELKGQWVEWDHEQMVTMYEGMVFKGPFIGTYEHKFKTWPVIEEKAGKVFLTIR